MSANCRAAAAKLRVKYAHVHGIVLDLVEILELDGDDAKVWVPSRPDLPVWFTGVIS